MFEQFSWDTGSIVYNLITMLVAFVLTLPMGIQRWHSGQNLGFRTIPLVALASTGYILVGQHFVGNDAGAHARLLQGLMTGIGFLGGGAIVKQGMSVEGTTTAASIWNTAAIGAAVAWNLYEVAVALAGINLAILLLLTPAKEKAAEEFGDHSNEDDQDDRGTQT